MSRHSVPSCVCFLVCWALMFDLVASKNVWYFYFLLSLQEHFHSLIEDLVDISISEGEPCSIHVHRKTGMPKVPIFSDSFSQSITLWLTDVCSALAKWVQSLYFGASFKTFFATKHRVVFTVILVDLIRIQCWLGFTLLEVLVDSVHQKSRKLVYVYCTLQLIFFQ